MLHAQRAPDEIRGTAIRAGPDMAIGQREYRVIGGYRQIAGSHQADPEACRRTANAGDHRLAHPADREERQVQHVDAFENGCPAGGRVQVETVDHCADIAASLEMVAGAADHHAARRVVTLQPGDHLAEGDTQFRGQRVAHLRLV